MELKLNDDEKTAFLNSVEVVRTAVSHLTTVNVQ